MRVRARWGLLPSALSAMLVARAAAFGGLPQDCDGQRNEGASPVQVTHIQFDHAINEPGRSGVLHLRKDYTTPIVKPEWVKDVRSGPALYVQQSPVVILARFEAPPTLRCAYVWAQGDGPPGGLGGRWILFSGGISAPEYYTFSAEYPAPAGMGCVTWNWRWMAACVQESGMITVGEMNLSGEHKAYTVLDAPGLPWDIATESNQNPWTDALDLALVHLQASTPEEALDEATRFCFDLPCFEYDIVSGAPCYIQSSWNFNLTLFIQDVNTGHPPRIGCCYDGGAIVHTLAGLLGAKTVFVLSGSPYTSHYFGYLNCIDPIGRGEDYSNNPFHDSPYYRKDPITYQDGSSSSCKRSLFGNHAFASTQAGGHGIIWDATMCADADENPDTAVKFPPDGSPVSTGLTATVLTDAGQDWTPGEWIGMFLNPNTNNTHPDPYKEFRIVDNTATTITVTSTANMLQAAKAGDHYWIRSPGDPEVDIIRLNGYPWFEYQGICLDQTLLSGGRADPPVQKAIKLL